MMQRTARDDWRKLKASGHGKRHADSAKDIERSASEARINIALNDVISSSFRQDHTENSSDNHFKSFVAKTA